MAERKTAFDAINSDSVDSFINNGPKTDISTRPDEIQHSDTAPKPTLNEQLARQTEPGRTEPSKQSRTFAKARIQKSVRFRPELIERLDFLIAEIEIGGRNPPSIQDAINEALDFWLKTRGR